MTLSDRARELADRLTAAIKVDIRPGDDDVPRVEIVGAETLIQAALMAVRREALEVAIINVDNLIGRYHDMTGDQWTAYVQSRRDAIRELRALLPDANRLPTERIIQESSADAMQAVAKFFKEMWEGCYRGVVSVGMAHGLVRGENANGIFELSDLGRAAIKLSGTSHDPETARDPRTELLLLVAAQMHRATLNPGIIVSREAAEKLARLIAEVATSPARSSPLAELEPSR